jgi:hypothetical protein|tara:strand:+ start:230 stop:1102 length:873 start_codon:yes stop_codon:yes gene_type:complete
MNKYYCKCCDYGAKVKSSYDKHLKTKKHKIQRQNVSPMLGNVSPMLGEISLNSKNEQKQLKCDYCDKFFKHRSSRSKHIKYTCKKNKDEDLKELARLLNEKIKDKDIQMENMQKQIDKLTNKLQIQQVNNTNTNIHYNVNNNIYLLDYKHTDYSHLTESDYITCINDCNYCVKSLIEKVHFNEKKSENMNIYISSIKGNYVMVYNDNVWQIHNKRDQIDDLFDYNEVILSKWYEDSKERYPEILNSFQKYLINKDDSDIINEVKHEILKMLYNKRNVLTNNLIKVEDDLL